MREMAPKEKKGKKSSQKKQVFRRGIVGLEYLPQQLRDWRIKKNITWGGYGVSKSWISVSKQCNSNNGSMPQLQLSCAIDSWIEVREHAKSHPPHHFLKDPYLPVGFYTSTCRHWWVKPHLFPSKSTSSSQGQIYIPPWGIMRTTGLSRPALLFLRPPQHQDPVRVECLDDTLMDPYDSAKQPVIFINIIRFEGKFYALSLQGALAVVEVDPSLKIVGVGKNRAVPSVPSRRFIQYLIESNGEILLVFLISSRKSTSMFDYVEVFKLDLVTLSWVMVDSLGDRALFLAGTTKPCLSFNTNHVGCKSSHVYFTHPGIDCWKEFDLESKSISSCCNF